MTSIRSLGLVCALGWGCTTVLAQTGPGPTPESLALPETTLTTHGLHSVELYESHNRLSAGYNNWRETGLRGLYRWGDHLLAGEAISMSRFNENGNYLGLSDTMVLSPIWYASLHLGAGDRAAYLPRYRVDAFLHRKLREDLSLVGNLGLGRYSAPDGHQDDNLSLGLTQYFTQPWVLEGQVKFNRSTPGDIHTRQYFVAATWGRYRQTLVTGRYGWGREGYQSLGDARSISEFASHQSTLSVQHWLGTDWGLKLSAEDYRNPYYTRQGLKLAVFKDLP